MVLPREDVEKTSFATQERLYNLVVNYNILFNVKKLKSTQTKCIRRMFAPSPASDYTEVIEICVKNHSILLLCPRPRNFT